MVDLVEGFVLECQARGLVEHTTETYESCCKDFIRRYPDPIAVRLEDLRAYLGELRTRGYQGSTLKGYFAAIAAFYDFLVIENKAASNPIPSFRKRYLRVKQQHGGENTRQLISIEQMRELISLSARKVLDKTMILFLAKTGLRRGELISMDISDLDLEKMEFRVKPKAKRSNRLGFMDAELTAALKEYLDWREPRAKDQALWINSSGIRVTRNYVYNMIVNYAKIAGLHDPHGAMNEKFTTHCTRHFFTTWLRRGGMSREFIQELRGDRRRDAIDIYDHIEVEELRRSYLKCIPYLNVGPGRPGTLEEWIK
ncbi:tyrosine-type recombinase/integrase [Candidatus Methanoperedens nitratireducens]|uniref:Site-specific recombinase n=1 Tax=Candidatus Methanoperedens nitratireducens TaxID=1392998 RepID=A0A284VRI0_9EURY|nr:tyrosine-type recombinase/integrase [Candidatus Methanoperedens nitroreducens]SNQ61895.1 Site-specific recombinase [Candidatus Methanoperedens nitroreducens]